MIKLNTENEAKAEAIAMSEDTIDACKSVANTQTIAGVSPFFQPHYANAKIDVYGVMGLVRDILRVAQAEFPQGIEGTALRHLAIAASLFTSEIIAEVQIRFSAGTTRYRPQSVRNCLSTYGKLDGTIAKIDLTPEEDQPRHCKIPRSKWYRVQGKE